MDKKTTKILIIAIIIQAIVMGIISLSISYKLGMLKSSEYKKAYIENHLETIYKNDMTYKKTKIGITGKKYIFTIDKTPEIEIATQYSLTINTHFLGEYLYDIGLKLAIRENYKEKVIEYLFNKYTNKKHIVDITGMNKFEATTLIYETYKNIRYEARNKYFIELPEGLNIKIEYQGKRKEILAKDLDRLNIISIFLEELKLPLQ